MGLLCSNVSDQRCENFLEKFYRGIRQDDDLYKTVNMMLQQNGIKISQEEFQKLNEKIDRNHTDLIVKIDGMVNTFSSNLLNEENITTRKLMFQNDKKQDYIKIWNGRLFLHQDNDEKPITLADAFIVPKFDYYIKRGEIKFSDKDSLTDAIEKFLNYNKTSNLLLIGSPGTGKTSIISWIANKYKDDEDIIVLRFRDWSNKDLEQGLLNAIYHSLYCRKGDLENKLLVLDGFDEIKIVNERKNLIREFLNNTLDFDNLKIIITSRHDYLDAYDFQNVFKILPFNISQVQEFFQIIKGIELDKGKIDCDNLDVLGIPVILYMAIMVDIDLTLKTTKPELYNKIFAEEGGIFDRFCFKGIGYDGGFQPLRDKKNIRIYLSFLQRVAFLMFEKNNLVLTEKEYDIPELIFQREKLKVVEFPIKPFFESDGDNIEFIHKSIYEYFVSENIFFLVSATINEDDKRHLAGAMGYLFKGNILSKEILEFFKFKIDVNLYNYFDDIITAFQIMLKDGLTYCTKNCYEDMFKCEMNVLTNMFEVIHLWEREEFRIDLFNTSYLRYNNFNFNLQNIKPINSDLQEIYLVGANLAKVNFRKVNLKGANLKGAILKKAVLVYADLKEANLAKTDLTEAELRGADLEGADLKGAKLINANLEYSFLKNADLRETELLGVDLSEVDLSATYLRGANLSMANLQKAYLSGLDLSNTFFSKARLIGANLAETNLTNANMRGAILKGAILRDAYLWKTDLSEADLSGADLTGAFLKRVHLQGANLSRIDLKKLDLTEVDLFGIIFDEDQINYLERKYDMQGTKVLINNTKKIVSYEEYQIKK